MPNVTRGVIDISGSTALAQKLNDSVAAEQGKPYNAPFQAMSAVSALLQILLLVLSIAWDIRFLADTKQVEKEAVK